MINISLAPSSDAWLQCVLDNFDEFLIDHAANERKASSMAMSMAAHYPDKANLVRRMVDLALEELTHFREVMRIMEKRGLIMTPDEKDPYVNALRKQIRSGSNAYFLDRLLSAAVIEARGEERFRRLAEALDTAELKAFYATLANSEAGHHRLFLELAAHYFDEQQLRSRLADWITIETSLVRGLIVRSRLH